MTTQFAWQNLPKLRELQFLPDYLITAWKKNGSGGHDPVLDADHVLTDDNWRGVVTVFCGAVTIAAIGVMIGYACYGPYRDMSELGFADGLTMLSGPLVTIGFCIVGIVVSQLIPIPSQIDARERVTRLENAINRACARLDVTYSMLYAMPRDVARGRAEDALVHQASAILLERKRPNRDNLSIEGVMVELLEGDYDTLADLGIIDRSKQGYKKYFERAAETIKGKVAEDAVS